jgi:hypothetical protein
MMLFVMVPSNFAALERGYIIEIGFAIGFRSSSTHQA